MKRELRAPHDEAGCSCPKLSRNHLAHQALGLRWWIVWTLFGSTVINYISRQTFSVLAPMITAQFHLSHTDLARIFGAFQISYAVTWFLGGIFLDVVGTRIGLAIAVVFWSAVNAATGLVNSVAGFAACRFLLGIGEGFNWPGASKTVAEWFPAEERSIAVAIFDSGSSVGGALAALVIPWIALRFRLALVVCLLRRARLRVADRVAAHLPPGLETPPAHSGRTRRHSRRPGSAADFGAARAGRDGFSLARDRNVWGTVLGRALTDPIWWFYVFWLPQYLSDARGFSLKRIAIFAWVPFVAADIGNFTGGFLSRSRIRRGASVVQARRWVCVMSCAAHAAGDSGRQGTQSLPGAPAYQRGRLGLCRMVDDGADAAIRSVSAGSGGNGHRLERAGGRLSAPFTIAVGVTVDRFSYGPAFLVAGCMPLVATACVLLLIRESSGRGRPERDVYPAKSATLPYDDPT